MKTQLNPWSIAVASAVLLAASVPPLIAQGDPPARVVRLGYAQGEVSLMAAGESDWTDAPGNYPMISGDRVYTGDNARVELSAGQTVVRMWQDTDVTVTNITDDYEQIGLAQGSIRVRVYGIDPNNTVEVDTPNGAAIITRPGDYRFDAYSGDDGSAVTVNVGSVQLTGPGLDQEIDGGQAVSLTGTDQIAMVPLEVAAFDPLDNWSITRDHHVLNSVSVRYVSPQMVGYDDLDDNGDWTPTPDYGPVWYPRATVAGWRPYTYGHWGYTPSYGYTWIDDASWGFAPFHYGRWVQVGPRWGWVPGPREVRPVYSPALVSFVGGGPGLSIGVSIGGGGGGVAAWFPLGVGEPYVPWYHCSPRYVNQVNVTNVNITNIHNTTIVNNYNTFITNTRTVNNVNQIRVNNINYSHRDAVVAVPANSFNSGQRVDRIQTHLTAQQTQTLAKAPVVVGRPPAPPPTRPIRQVRANVAAPAARPALMTPHGVAKATPQANTAHVQPASLPKPKPATALAKPAPGAARPVMGAGGKAATHPPAPAAGARPGTPAAGTRPGTPALGAKPGTAAPAAAGARPAAPAPGARPGNAAAPARPGTPAAGAKPGTPPAGAKPGTPAEAGRPATAAPATRPGATPAPARPGTPAANTRPGASPSANRPTPQPGARPAAPEARPVPNRPGTPAERPQSPSTRPAPAARPETPAAKPPARPAGKPEAAPRTPPARNEAAPAARPATPGARPAPAARPAPEARPAPPNRPQTPPPAHAAPQAHPATQPPARKPAPPPDKQKKTPPKEEPQGR